jgi:hypothetical protein
MSAVLAGARQHRGVLSVALGVLAVLVVLTVVAARPPTRGEPLDPDNPSPDGAQAVARVLADRGVDVTVVRRAGELDRTAVDATTTVLVTSSENLGRSTARGLEERSARAGALVLAAPGAVLLGALDLPVTVGAARTGGRTRGRTEARCDDPLLAGLTLEVPASRGYRAGRGSVETCFRGEGDGAASLVARIDRRAVTYAVGAAELFSNQRVDRADNAAAALRLLGQQDRLVWYVPDPRDVPSGDTGSPADQLPGGLFPALWLLVAAVLATMLWRGRRLGPLVSEPLPVVVRAVESTQGRGRIYRRVRDRGHAADTGPARVAAAVAEATGADARAVHDLLVTAPVTDDTELTRLADDLAALEREVHPR